MNSILILNSIVSIKKIKEKPVNRHIERHDIFSSVRNRFEGDGCPTRFEQHQNGRISKTHVA